MHLQEWVASVRVPSEEATALSRMADAAAAAAAFTADGMKTHGHGTLTQQAQRAELAKRAQQASDAVLRGDSDAASLQEIDSRSYSRCSFRIHRHDYQTLPFVCMAMVVSNNDLVHSCMYHT